MTPRTRRRFVQLSGSLALAGLAGCTGEGSTDAERPSSDLPDSTDGGAQNSTSDSETSSDGEQSVDESSEAEPDSEEAESSADDPESEENASEPYDYKEVHKHGQLYFFLDGEQIHLGAQEENWAADQYVYFSDDDNDDLWHLHARGVTVEYALNTLPSMSYEEGELTYEGETYGRDRVSIQVNGEETDPAEHELDQGDTIRLVVGSG